MLRLLPTAALASAAIIAAIPNSPASAMALTIHNVGAGPRVGAVGGHFAFDAPVITDHTPHDKPAVKKWVCGPLVNYDGTPHCHWVTH